MFFLLGESEFRKSPDSLNYVEIVLRNARDSQLCYGLAITSQRFRRIKRLERGRLDAHGVHII